MFTATRPSVFFDQLRIPYELGTPAGLWSSVDERSPLRQATRYEVANGKEPHFVAWPGAELQDRSSGEFLLESLPLYGHLLPDAVCESWLASTGEGWRRTTPILDAEGRRLGALWRDASGNAFLPFEPDEVIVNFLSEAYKGCVGSPLDGAAAAAARTAYYRVKRAVPRPLQLMLRRALVGVQRQRRFPRWPVEPALTELNRLLYLLLTDVARRPVPWIAPWPNGFSWALVLTHDVETRFGYESLHLMRDIELEAGVRSSWNLVPTRYEPRTRYHVTDKDVRELDESGFEVGVHGLKHDGRDVASLALLEERLPRMREYAERWNAVGFRSPATHRNWDWMPLLGFDYDSSYSDTDPYEPQGGGCCSWLPYFNRDTVELPITLPQDHTVFAILGHRNEDAWVEKTSLISKQGGMALMLTHPDYMTEPHLLAAYRRFLGRYGADDAAWRALPREVSSWWRRRAASGLTLVRGEWAIEGPAAGEASVVLEAPRGVG
jgi:peptidoglycan/xylan/chitin deacetylase (PgdA/CDA1 family)